MRATDEHPEARPAFVYPVLFFGVLSFSISAILVRFAGDMPGLAVAAWRTVFAVVMLAPYALPRIAPEVRRFTGRERLLIAGAGVMLGLHFVTWIESLYHTSVASASVIVSTTPLFLAVFGYWLLRERLSRRVVVSIVLAVTGTALIAWGDTLGPDRAEGALFGNGLALAAVLFQCFYMLVGRVVRQKTSWPAYVFPLYTCAALTTVAVALIRGVPLFGYDRSIYGLCALMALFPQLLGHGSFNFALKFFKAAFLGLLGLTEPVIASILAFFLFDEMPTPVALTGMTIVLLSVFAVIRSRRRTPLVEPEM
jgi:drug/metabolite transporter (DMT)-like permease